MNGGLSDNVVCMHNFAKKTNVSIFNTLLSCNSQEWAFLEGHCHAEFSKHK